MMTEDLPMFDAYNADDAEMIAEDEFDYEMQEEPTGAVQEYDMTREDQADYEDVIQAEPIVETTATTDVPIVEAEPVLVQPDVVSQPIPPPEVPTVIPAVALPLAPPPVEIVSEVPLTVASDTFDSAPPVVDPAPAAYTSPTQVTTEPAGSPVVHIPELGDNPVAAQEPINVSETAPRLVEPENVEQQPESEATEGEEGVPTTVPTDLHEALPPAATFSTPPITFYLENQVFSLFTSVEPESAPAVLLSGRQDLYLAPLSQLLREIRIQEHHNFPGIEDCVLGLEYPELDLCIDENCKYADKYSLEDLSKALVTCNHPNIGFNIFQISDFELSLSERLKGNLPPVVVTELITGEDPALEAEQATVPEGLPEHDTGEALAVSRYDNDNAEGSLAPKAGDEEDGNAEVHTSAKEISPVRAANAETSPPPSPGAVQEHGAQPAIQDHNERPDIPEHPAQGTAAPETASEERKEEPPADRADEPRAANDISDNTSVSSATLESTDHEALQYEVEEVDEVEEADAHQEHADVEKDEDEPEVEIVTVDDADERDELEDGVADEEQQEEQEQEYYPDEHNEHAATHGSDSNKATAGLTQEGVGDVQKHASETSADFEGEDVNSQVESTLPVDEKAANQPLPSSPLTEEEEFPEYYDDLEEQVEAQPSLTTVNPGSPHDKIPGLAANHSISEKGETKEPSPVHVPAPERQRSLSGGKRPFDETDVYDGDEYADPDDYSVDAKRPRMA